MTKRNLNPNQMFMSMAAEHQPKHHFTGSSREDFAAWKAAAQPEVMSCLGRFPARVAPDPELVVDFEDRGIRQQRWMINVLPHLSASVLVNVPAGLKKEEKRPAILCWHGHGPFGKEPVMGNSSSPDMAANAAAHNYDYGRQMAMAGFVTFAVNWIGCGEMSPARKPNHNKVGDGRDWCNLLYLHATMFGMTSISVNVRIGMAATDFVCGHPNIDAARLGVMGLSGGGTMTTWTAFCDERFRAAEIICYCDLWETFGMRDINYCGMQVAPGLYALVDLPDLQGLLAPMPLLIDIGARDTCFQIDSAMPAYRQVEKIYAAAGASALLELDLHPNEHAWGGNKSVRFFSRHLGMRV